MTDPSSLKTVIASEVQQAIVVHQKDMLTQLDTLISNRFSTFQEQISSTQKQLSESQLEKIQDFSHNAYTFRRKGNEEQHKVNSKVLTKISDAQNLLTSSTVQDPNVHSAQQKIVEGMDILNKRQKLIKLADMSDYGWSTVAEYETHTLADNSDDEKRIVKAENRAERKIKQKRKSSAGKRFHPYTQSATTSVNPEQNKEKTVITTTRSKPGLCFACGKPGHWRSECELMKGASHNKISICEIFSELLPHEVLNFDKIEVLSENHLSTFSNSGTMTDSRRENNEIVLSPVGRLRARVEFWKAIGASDFIIDVIENGYKLPLYSLPERKNMQNNKSALDNNGFVQQEITALLQRGCVTEVFSEPIAVNPLTVANKDGRKLRLVLDCRHINPNLFKFKFCYEDASIARQTFRKGDYLFTFDLQSAYHHVHIFPAHRQYLGFSWIFGTKTRFFVFNVLPFGISTAGYIFTKLTKCVLKYWRAEGIRVIMYLDDGIGGGDDKKSAEIVSDKVHSDLMKLGFLVAEHKSAWFPTKSITWLGIDWNTNTGMMTATERRLSKIYRSMQVITEKTESDMSIIAAKEMASLIGQIVSLHYTAGKVVFLFTRAMYACLLTKASWKAPVLIDTDVKSEIKFWQKNLRKFDGQPFNSPVEFDYTAYSDASGRGYGGYVIGSNDSEVLGSWSELEMLMSSTWREMEAVHRVLKSSEQGLEGRLVKWYTDNKNVVLV